MPTPKLPSRRKIAGEYRPFIFPHFQPPLILGRQAPKWQEGGPSGDLAVKADTPQPQVAVIGFCGVLTPQRWVGIVAPPGGVPATRPRQRQVSFGKVAEPRLLTIIKGLMKAPNNG